MVAKGVLFCGAILCCAFVIGQSTSSGISSPYVEIDAGPLIDYLYLVLDNVQNLLVASDPKDAGGYHLDSFTNNSVSDPSSADFESTVISGISSFNVDSLTFEVTSLTGNLQLTWPLLSVVCTYSAEELIAGSTTAASGDLSISYQDIVLNGTLAFGFNDTALVVTLFELDLTHGTSAVELTNLVGSAEVQDDLQRYVEELTEQVFDTLAAKFAALGGDDAAEVINPTLAMVGSATPKQLMDELFMMPNRLMSKVDWML